MDLVSAQNSDRPRASAAGRWLCVALGLLGLLGTGEALRRWLPPPPASALTTKLEHLAEHGDDYDVLVVGSSHVYRQIDPARFDEVLARRGHPLRTYNLGVPAMQGLETLHALREVLARRPERLRWVLLDVRDAGAELQGRNHLTARVAAWHDLPTTLLAVGLALRSEAPWLDRWDQVGRHLLAWGLRLGQVGRLRELVEPRVVGNAEYRQGLVDTREADRVMERGRIDDGYAPLDWALTVANAIQRRLLAERQTAFLEDADELLGSVDARRAEGRRLLNAHDGSVRADQRLRAGERRLLAAFAELVEGAGAELVFVNGPDLRQRGNLLVAGAREGLIDPLLDLDDPQRHPAFFRAANIFDSGHLNERGAELYSRALAQAFVRFLDDRPDPQDERP